MTRLSTFLHLDALIMISVLLINATVRILSTKLEKPVCDYFNLCSGSGSGTRVLEMALPGCKQRGIPKRGWIWGGKTWRKHHLLELEQKTGSNRRG